MNVECRIYRVNHLDTCNFNEKNQNFDDEENIKQNKKRTHIFIQKNTILNMSKHPFVPILTSVVGMLMTLGVIVGSYSVGIALLFWAPPAWAADICLLQITSALVLGIVASMAAIDYFNRSEDVASIKHEKPTSTNSANALLQRKGSRTGLASYDSSPRLNRGLFSPRKVQ